ncbi:hypothetical protein DCC39_11585 [Pueribacillus theae]|uniref:Transcription regulator PadR N-terminal domain-containing protein n=1 Tax=Pueribacillus theae TaxID=2171751 RepID=A0A2U1JYP8_9BACI|nr:PadR family transcriptional regulator [Pueribacillus theae]PWA10350.1 hypothetical protein DCC39_11585 [Pueribacillus theae]
MYELLVLALLMKFPLHAYLISKIANDTIGPWEKFSRGTLSTLLNKLEKDGLIKEADSKSVPFPSKRSSRTFDITSKGRARFYELMMETEKGLGNYPKVFHIKAIYFEFLEEEDQLALINHYIRYCQKAINHIKEQQKEFDDNPEMVKPVQESSFYQTIRSLMDLQLEQWALELRWSNELKDQLKASITNKEKGE